jgi:hypothetical protein
MRHAVLVGYKDGKASIVDEGLHRGDTKQLFKTLIREPEKCEFDALYFYGDSEQKFIRKTKPAIVAESVAPAKKK